MLDVQCPMFTGLLAYIQMREQIHRDTLSNILESFPEKCDIN